MYEFVELNFTNISDEDYSYSLGFDNIYIKVNYQKTYHHSKIKLVSFLSLIYSHAT